MQIDLKTLKIPSNYCLIKPDEDLNTYQMGGRETGITVAQFTYEKGNSISIKEKHQSVKGTLYKLPERLVYNGHTIKKLREENNIHAVVQGERRLVDFSLQSKVDNLTLNSVIYDNIIEAKEGDRVFFTYLAHKKAIEENKILETSEGKMYLIRYDMLYMTLKEEKPDKMLNGWVIIEPEHIETKKTEGGLEYVEGQGGIIIPVKSTENRSRKMGKAKVLYSGRPNSSYLQEPKSSDNVEISNGERIVYDPRGSKQVEISYHQTLSEKPLQFIQRKDILFTERNFDLDAIDFHKIKRRK